MSALRRRGSGEGERGQSLVELALILPLFMILLLGLLEGGFIFAHQQGLEYATREGARTGSALSNGAPAVGVPCAQIDNQIIAAVQRVITGKGSLVNINYISQIRIWKSDTSGNPIAGYIEVWTPGAGAVVDGTALKFKQTGGTWDACARNNSSAFSGGQAMTDALGVDLSYTYHMTTSLGSILQWTGGNMLAMYDKTIMVLNP